MGRCRLGKAHRARTGSVNILPVGLEYTIRVVTCVLG